MPNIEWAAAWCGQDRNGVFLSHLYIKTIILPRQARDKHRENSQKRAFPHQCYIETAELDGETNLKVL